jgi:hypothetical protein
MSLPSWTPRSATKNMLSRAGYGHSAGYSPRVRAVAPDVHRDFCDVAIVAEGRQSSPGTWCKTRRARSSVRRSAAQAAMSSTSLS